eukprot:Nk52_evm68s207 gene=Nk52_evmTU68s207
MQHIDNPVTSRALFILGTFGIGKTALLNECYEAAMKPSKKKKRKSLVIRYDFNQPTKRSLSFGKFLCEFETLIYSSLTESAKGVMTSNLVWQQLESSLLGLEFQRIARRVGCENVGEDDRASNGKFKRLIEFLKENPENYSKLKYRCPEAQMTDADIALSLAFELMMEKEFIRSIKLGADETSNSSGARTGLHLFPFIIELLGAIAHESEKKKIPGIYPKLFIDGLKEPHNSAHLFSDLLLLDERYAAFHDNLIMKIKTFVDKPGIPIVVTSSSQYYSVDVPMDFQAAYQVGILELTEVPKSVGELFSGISGLCSPDEWDIIYDRLGGNPGELRVFFEKFWDNTDVSEMNEPGFNPVVDKVNHCVENFIASRYRSVEEDLNLVIKTITGRVVSDHKNTLKEKDVRDRVEIYMFDFLSQFMKSGAFLRYEGHNSRMLASLCSLNSLQSSDELDVWYSNSFNKGLIHKLFRRRLLFRQTDDLRVIRPQSKVIWVYMPFLLKAKKISTFIGYGSPQ